MTQKGGTRLQVLVREGEEFPTRRDFPTETVDWSVGDRTQSRRPQQDGLPGVPRVYVRSLGSLSGPVGRWRVPCDVKGVEVLPLLMQVG